MRKHIIYRTLFIGVIISVLLFSGCTEDSDLGVDLLPKNDLIEVKSVVIKDQISSFTFREDSIKTDESGRSLLGSMNDPVFGNTTINYATQFRLQRFPDFGENVVADSVKLILRYTEVYGDLTTPQRIKVYELESAIDPDEDYYQEVDLKELASTKVIGELEFLPQIVADSTTGDTLQQLLAIKLDDELGQKLVEADSSILANNDNFLEYFKGLYLEMEKKDEGGAIIGLDELTNNSQIGMGIVVYYNNDENRDADPPDTLFIPYLVSNFSARVNSITHDYSGTAFIDNLNSEQTEDSLIYVQSTGGLKSRILINDLSHWNDSVNTAINKAELVFQIDSVISDVHNYEPPSQLLFTVVNEDGEEFLPRDYSFSPVFYGGGLNKSDYTYRFNITQHLQELIEGRAENYGFYLTTANKNSEANRVVLKGSRSQTGIKLNITYSKFSN